MTLYASPEEARNAPPEEFLYLACLHEGTGVRAPDFLAVVDAGEGRIVHETPMPNVGDEHEPSARGRRGLPTEPWQ
jgi:56kDa selenium binding protein (SBP56)